MYVLGLLNKAYYRLRKSEISKAKSMLKRVKVDFIFEGLTKSCWKNGLEYETLMKNNEVLEIRVKGRKEEVLIKFHKANMVFLEDYERFLLMMETLGIKKGVYITTGVFEGRIIRNNKKAFPFTNNVKIEDNYAFIKSQLGIHVSAADVFKNKKLTFYNYLPS
jgi:hypothetical protein